MTGKFDSKPWRVWHWMTPVGTFAAVWHPRFCVWAWRHSEVVGGYAADLGKLTLSWGPVWPPRVPV